MHITLESDYAIRIVACLASEQRRMDAKSIADMTDVTLRFSLKILRKLVVGGVVRSFKGVQGGYELAKHPGDISLNDVIEIFEGTYRISRCLCEDFECASKHHYPCAYKHAFAEISEMVQEKMKSYTFDKLTPYQEHTCNCLPKDAE